MHSSNHIFKILFAQVLKILITERFSVFLKLEDRLLGLERGNGNRNSGIPILNKTRTEIYYIKKENIFNFQQKSRFLEKIKQGELCCGKFIFLVKIHFHSNFLFHPWRELAVLFQIVNQKLWEKNKNEVEIISYT